MQTVSRLTAALVYAGALPFLIAALLNRMPDIAASLPVSPVEIYLSYALAIISFLCGTHWSLALRQTKGIARSLAVISNITVVALWLAYLFLSPLITCLVLLAALMVLLTTDQKLAQYGLFNERYYTLRSRITLIVVLTTFLLITSL